MYKSAAIYKVRETLLAEYIIRCIELYFERRV